MKCLKLILLFAVFMPITTWGQETFVNPLEKGFVHNFTDDGKYFIKVGPSLEFWARYSQMNPGTIGYDGKELKSDLDFVLRRTLGSINLKLDKIYFFTMGGLGTQTYTTSASPYTTAKPSFFMLDVFGYYNVIPDKLKIGYGLNLYRGLARYTSSSATRALGIDPPSLSGPDGTTTDENGRHLGFFAAGNVGMLNYRLNLGKPFVVTSSSRPAYGVNKAADIPNNQLSFEGYFAFQFFDKEIGPLPFSTSSYLGKKKIFNIGAGFIYHPKETQSYSSDSSLLTHDEKHFAVDMYLDLPMANSSVLTCYLAAYVFDFGPNYLLNGGTANVYSTTGGITEPASGTGTAIGSQLAYILPKTFGPMGKLQFYYEGEYRFYDALNDAAIHYNFGMTFFQLAHNLKFTLEYQMRPYFAGASFDSYKSLIVLKTQILL